MGLHHKLCHVLGGNFDLPWAPAADQALADALKATDAAAALFDLTAALGAPRSLTELGITLNDVDTIVSEVLAVPYASPRPVDEANLRELVESAIIGRRHNQ